MRLCFPVLRRDYHHSCSDIIRQLLARGSDPTAPSDSGLYPLTAAAEVGFTEIIPELAHADRYRWEGGWIGFKLGTYRLCPKSRLCCNLVGACSVLSRLLALLCLLLYLQDCLAAVAHIETVAVNCFGLFVRVDSGEGAGGSKCGPPHAPQVQLLCCVPA